MFKKIIIESEITKDVISDRLHYLTTNDKLINKPTNGKESYFILYERLLQNQHLLDTSAKLIPFEEQLLPKVWLSNGADLYLNEEYLNLYENISGEQEITNVTSSTNNTESIKKKYKKKKESLTFELTTSELFVKEQLFMIRNS